MFQQSPVSASDQGRCNAGWSRRIQSVTRQHPPTSGSTMRLRLITFGMVGMLLAGPVLAQDATPSPSPRFTVRVRPKIHMEHRHSLNNQVRLQIRGARTELRMRNRMHIRMRPFKMRDFHLRVRPKVRFRAGTAEI